MENPLISQLLVSIFLAFIILCRSQNQCENPNNVRAGFWFSDSNHYSSLSNITSSLYTHLYYYSLSIDKTSFKINLPPQNQLQTLTSFSSLLKSKNPSLNTLISIATDDHETSSSNGAFSIMAANPNIRSAVIDSTIELAREFAFDGIDLAWKFPNSPSDMANLAIFLSEWRAHVNDAVSPLLLTATVYFSNHLFDGPTDDLDYPISAISENLDWINALCFGYHKSNELSTTADAPLYDKTTHFSTSYGIRSWLDAGIPSCKLVMGIPLYGRSWFLKNKEKNGFGAQAVAAGPREKLSNRTGVMAYFEITEVLKESTTSVTFDNETVSSYLHNGGLWVSFDSTEVVDEKIKFSLRNGLLGYFLWSISFDDLNKTISERASDAWKRYNASGVGKIGYEEAPSPAQMNPQDFAPYHSTDSSQAMKRSPQMILCFCTLSFLIFNLVTV